MRTLFGLSIHRYIPVVIALTLSVSHWAAAADDALLVKVLPDRYVSAGNSFNDVATLAAWSGHSRSRALSLESCGAASTRQLLAAVERFQATYPDGIRIRSLLPGEPGCPGDAEYLASDAAGRSMLP